MTTDEEADAAVHDEAWFAALFAAHATPLYRYFRRRLPSTAGSVGPDADDLTAEVLATAWRRREDVPDGAELPVAVPHRGLRARQPPAQGAGGAGGRGARPG